MDNLDLNLLRVLDALLRYQHVGRAAAALGMSQPGFSYALRRLRTYFNDPLFLRTRAGMQPTSTAERLAPTVQQVLAQVRNELAPARSFEASRDERVFTLGMSDLGEMIVLPKLMRALAREAPGVDLRVSPSLPQELGAALARGEVDLAIGYYPECRGTDIFQQRLYTHGFTCLARRGHPRVGREVDRETFLSLPHATIRTTGRSQHAVEQHFERQGLKRRMRLTTPSILSTAFVVAATDVVVTVPTAVAELFGSLASVQSFTPPLKLPRITIRQYWHRRQHSDAANQWLRSMVRALFSGPDGWRLSTPSSRRRNSA
jgi:DNA-binding transcriptional LysR family regulator